MQNKLELTKNSYPNIEIAWISETMRELSSVELIGIVLVVWSNQYNF